MYFSNFLNRIVDKLHLQSFIKSTRKFLADERGGFLLPIELKLNDKEYEEYRHLSVDWSIRPITKNLPQEFSQKAVNTVDLFNRKTFNLPYECMIMFDYIDGSIVFCSLTGKKSPNQIKGIVFPNLLKNRHIASIHNHPNSYYAPPSCKNFQMLGLEFEKFELIISYNELWILESFEKLDSDEISLVREKANYFFNFCFEQFNCEFDKGHKLIENVDKCYGDLLLNYINNKYENIKLIRRYLYE